MATSAVQCIGNLRRYQKTTWRGFYCRPEVVIYGKPINGQNGHLWNYQQLMTQHFVVSHEARIYDCHLLSLYISLMWRFRIAFSSRTRNQTSKWVLWNVSTKYTNRRAIVLADDTTLLLVLKWMFVLRPLTTFYTHCSTLHFKNVFFLLSTTSCFCE